MITSTPMVIVIILIYFSLKCVRTLFTTYERPSHQSIAPAKMLMNPKTSPKKLVGTTKVSCAKRAMKRKMMRGLANVTKNAEIVVEQCPLLSRRLVHAFCRVGAEGDDAEYEQESASYDLQPEYGFGVVDEIHDKRHAKACNGCIEKVTCSGSGTGDQSVVASLVDGALQAENACGAHGGGDDDADNQAFEH